MAAQYGKMVMRDVIPPWAEMMVGKLCGMSSHQGIEKVNGRTILQSMFSTYCILFPAAFEALGSMLSSSESPLFRAEEAKVSWVLNLLFPDLSSMICNDMKRTKIHF
jgi:hypothetical protein